MQDETLKDSCGIIPEDMFDYAAFLKRFRIACAAPEDAPCRREFKREINTLCTKMNSEEAALQLVVYRLMHMHLELYEKIDFNISTDLLARSVDHYASQYTISDIWMDPKLGGPAVILRPDDPSKAVILMSRGTIDHSGGDVVAKPHWPTGVRDDVHPKGVGHISCKWLSPRVQKLAESCIEHRQRLVMVGHSLGASVVLGLMGELHPLRRSHVDVIAFKPAGISKKIAKNIRSDADRIRCFVHKWDLVRFFGECMPACILIKMSSLAGISIWIQIPHGVPQLSVCSLKRIEPSVEISREDIRNGWMIYESARAITGKLVGHLLPS